MALVKPRIVELVDYGISQGFSGDFWNGLVFLTVKIPILRDSQNNEPTVAGFKINATLGELSSIFGRTVVNLQSSFEVEQDYSENRLSKIGVEILNPHPSLNKSSAQLYSGTDIKWSDSKFSLIGIGALGSQFFMNLARSGFGKWNLIICNIKRRIK